MARCEFSGMTKAAAYARAQGLCGACQQPLQHGKIQYDHILPDALGGKPVLANCMPMCSACHKIKTGKEDVPRIRKADRQRRDHIGAKTAPAKKIESAPFPKSGKAKVERASVPPRPLYRNI